MKYFRFLSITLIGDLMDIQKVVCLTSEELVENMNALIIFDWSFSLVIFVTCLILCYLSFCFGVRTGYRRTHHASMNRL